MCYNDCMDDMRIPPNNVEAERAVLGSILLDTTGRDERVMDICQSAGVTPDTFYDPRNREIYSEMRKMSRAAKPLDALTLIEEPEEFLWRLDTSVPQKSSPAAVSAKRKGRAGK